MKTPLPLPRPLPLLLLLLLLLLPLTCALLLVPPSTVRAEGESPAPSLEERASAFVDLLREGRFEDAAAWYDEAMRRALPADKLESTWKTLLSQAGSFAERIGVKLQRAQGYDIALVTCRFENASIDVKVVFDDQRRVAGLFFLPTPPGNGS